MGARLMLDLAVKTGLLVLVVGCAKPDEAGRTRAAADTRDTEGRTAERVAMVRDQIEARGVRDTAVLQALRTVPRHHFVPGPLAAFAYTDQPLPIGFEQTISQPFIVAYMAEAADIAPGDRVLEIGTGSGYGAAVLAQLAGEVYTIEIIAGLADRAREVLQRAGYGSVHVRTGNGWLGWPEHAPYDAIVVTAAPDEVPQALIDQLAVEGVLVIPVGGQTEMQRLRVLRKTADGLREEASLPVMFVPMMREPPDTGR